MAVVAPPSKNRYINRKDQPMPQAQAETMTLHEKLQIMMRSSELEKQGKKEEAMKIGKQVPLAPYLAKNIKDLLGLEALLQGFKNWIQDFRIEKCLNIDS
jgi:hypothetical protein